jgi:5-formyltetrahydrofolate cyclo-ligase
MSSLEEAERKAALRAQILTELRQMTADERASRSAAVREHVVESDAWKRSARVLLFSPLRAEPDIASLSALGMKSGKQVAAIPSTARIEAELQLPFAPELILVPGLAFSTDRHRLGRGGGFYDRLLAGRARAAFKLGICFRFQIRAMIPHEEHDVVLDAVISD